MVYGYLRVSTKGQKDNNSFDQQETEIIAKHPGAKIYKEQFTGGTIDRPVFNEVIGLLQPGDTLAVTKLDRMARTVKEGIALVEEMFRRGVAVHVLNVGLLEDTALGKFFITTLLAVAELEKSMILERMEGGKAIARLDPNYREGRPGKYSYAQKELALELLEAHTTKKVSLMTGIPERSLYRIKKVAKELESCATALEGTNKGK